MGELREMMGNLTNEEYDKVIAEAKTNRINKENRKNNSNTICKIPDWTGQGGMVEFWINDDNKFEAESFTHKQICQGLEILLQEAKYNG